MLALLALTLVWPIKTRVLPVRLATTALLVPSTQLSTHALQATLQAPSRTPIQLRALQQLTCALRASTAQLAQTHSQTLPLSAPSATTVKQGLPQQPPLEKFATLAFIQTFPALCLKLNARSVLLATSAPLEQRPTPLPRAPLATTASKVNYHQLAANVLTDT